VSIYDHSVGYDADDPRDTNGAVKVKVELDYFSTTGSVGAWIDGNEGRVFAAVDPDKLIAFTNALLRERHSDKLTALRQAVVNCEAALETARDDLDAYIYTTEA
jgi:hypothetical protein